MVAIGVRSSTRGRDCTDCESNAVRKGPLCERVKDGRHEKGSRFERGRGRNWIFIDGTLSPRGRIGARKLVSSAPRVAFNPRIRLHPCRERESDSTASQLGTAEHPCFLLSPPHVRPSSSCC